MKVTFSESVNWRWLLLAYRQQYALFNRCLEESTYIDLLGIRIFTLCGLEVKSDVYTNQRLISPPITYQAGWGGGDGDGGRGCWGRVTGQWEYLFIPVCICSFLLYFHHMMLVNVKLNISFSKRITFQGSRLHWSW